MQVKHSQRMNDKPLKPWVIVLPDGSITSAHFTCMAGLGEVCSHAASIVFAIYCQKRQSESCTDKLSKWTVPVATKKISPKKLKDINWGKPIKSYGGQ